MNTIQIGHITRSTPASWNELTKKQLLLVASMLQSGMTKIEFRTNLLFKFLSIKKKQFLSVDPNDVHFLSQTLEFLHDGVDLTKNLIPSFRFKLQRYWGPSDSLLNCTFGEFTKAHTLLELYTTKQDDLALDKIVAILYRPKKFLWRIRRYLTDVEDCRVRLKDRTLKTRAIKFAKVDPILKYCVFLQFSGVMKSFPGRFPNVYRKKEDAQGSSLGWISLIIALSDGKTDTPNINLVMNSNLYNVFLGLEQKSIDYFRQLEKLNQK